MVGQKNLTALGGCHRVKAECRVSGSIGYLGVVRALCRVLAPSGRDWYETASLTVGDDQVRRRIE